MDEPPHPASGRGARQHRARPRRGVQRPPVGEMDHDIDGAEMFRPVRQRTELADRAKLDAVDGFGRAARQAEDCMAALDQPAAQRAADEAGCTRHQNARQA